MHPNEAGFSCGIEASSAMTRFEEALFLMENCAMRIKFLKRNISRDELGRSDAYIYTTI